MFMLQELIIITKDSLCSKECVVVCTEDCIYLEQTCNDKLVSSAFYHFAKYLCGDFFSWVEWLCTEGSHNLKTI